ncbi:MAG: 4-hydroxy-tetrahydrodipicolinate synthase [archaeon GB-1845-036]|nr:4-hydroxy-tetrahydrodipicolinate synthase [Candidatus Culexmicrobium thermophilum]RLE53732.1 MAG: 4-hydroxy-tetrahydrodipicolinate synthase [Candidatus Verstraetearchaeota archaeon]
MDLKGIYVPHITPFKRDGSVDYEALKICVDFWVESRLAGLVTLGSNGEFPYLNGEERRKVVETVIDQVNSRVKVIVGTGAPSTRETILMSKEAFDLGADAIIVVTPYYFKVSDDELFHHYSEVLSKVDAPIILYDVPKFTGYSMGVSVVERLADEFSNVAGIKDSTGSMLHISELIRRVGNRISVLAGTASMMLPTLMLGGKGAVVAVANFIPEISVKLYSSFISGDISEASKLQLIINDIWSSIGRFNQIAAVKALTALRGLPAGLPRKPILPVDEAGRVFLRGLLEKYSVI